MLGILKTMTLAIFILKLSCLKKLAQPTPTSSASSLSNQCVLEPLRARQLRLDLIYTQQHSKETAFSSSLGQDLA